MDRPLSRWAARTATGGQGDSRRLFQFLPTSRRSVARFRMPHYGDLFGRPRIELGWDRRNGTCEGEPGLPAFHGRSIEEVRELPSEAQVTRTIAGGVACFVAVLVLASLVFSAECVESLLEAIREVVGCRSTAPSRSHGRC